MEAPAAGVPLPVGAPAAQPQAGPGTGQNVVVHLSHYTDDLHAVQMALTVANSLRSQGAGVTLLLDQEGARAADKRQPVGLRWGLSGSFDEAYDAFVKAGGKVLVCPHCAAVVDLEERVLRPGAAIADDEAEFTAVILGADKVVDY
jgi:predicted peroxiredoxin